jgi:hypothetical protein
MILDQKSATQVGLYLMGQGCLVEGEPEFNGRSYEMVIDTMAVSLTENVGIAPVISVEFAGNTDAFAHVTQDYATPQLLATIIHTMLHLAVEQVHE